MIGVLKSLAKDNKQAFSTIVKMSIFQGIINAFFISYFALFVFNNLSPGQVVFYSSAGATLSIFLMLPIYRRLFSMIETAQSRVVLAIGIFVLADFFNLIAYYSKTLAPYMVFLNTFIAVAAAIFYHTEIENFLMKIYNYKNRAKIVTTRTVLTNISAIITLFIIYLFIPYIPVLVLSIMTLFRIGVVKSLFGYPPIKSPKIELVTPKHFGILKKLWPLVILYTGTSLFGRIKSATIQFKLGTTSVPLLSAITLIVSTIVFMLISKHTFSVRKTTRVISLVLAGFSALMIFGYESTIIFPIVAILFDPIMGISSLSYRHKVMKSLPKDDTKDVLYLNNLLSMISNFVIMIVSMFVNGTFLSIYTASAIIIILAAISIAFQK